MTLKQKREEARKAGFCGTCCIRPVSPELKYCEECAESSRARRVRARSGDEPDTWCMQCIAYGFHRYDCPKLTTPKRRAPTTPPPMGEQHA